MCVLFSFLLFRSLSCSVDALVPSGCLYHANVCGMCQCLPPNFLFLLLPIMHSFIIFFFPGFLNCPLCQNVIKHSALSQFLQPMLALQTDVQAKSVLVALSLSHLLNRLNLFSPCPSVSFHALLLPRAVYLRPCVWCVCVVCTCVWCVREYGVYCGSG